MSSTPPQSLILVANARMPSERAQSLQVAQVSAAFARRGVSTKLLYARRFPTPALPEGQDLFGYYNVPEGARPDAIALPNIDFIDRVPTRAQFVPARIQELSFANNAARWISKHAPNAWVISRELETARKLVRSPTTGVFLELHRVPSGRTRRRWLIEAARGAKGVIAISGGVREDLVELGVDPASILVEHDAVEAGRFADLPSRAEAREALGLSPNKPLVVYTGGLMTWKGVDHLIEAARSLPELEFVIAGGMKSDVERIRSLAAGLGNVRLEGFQPPQRIALYLAAGDLGVVPNRSKPLISSRYTSPLKVFESMAAGLPLVASDLPSLREILVDERHARFVEPDCGSALAAGIQSLMSDGELREKMAAAGRSRSSEITWDARAERILTWMAARA